MGGALPTKLRGPKDEFVEIHRAWRDFLGYTWLVTGDGRRVRFRTDVWCGGAALASPFPQLYNIAKIKEALVAEYLWISKRG